jgi:hypothetical protein
MATGVDDPTIGTDTIVWSIVVGSKTVPPSPLTGNRERPIDSLGR